MVYLASDNAVIGRTGEFLAFGGGQITLKELEEAERSGLKPTVYPDFNPCARGIAVRRQSDPHSDVTPVRTAYRD